MEALGNGESMEGVNFGENGTYNPAAEEDEVTLAKAEARDEHTVFVRARRLDHAIADLLQLEHIDPAKQSAANEWLAQFVTKPFAWTAALSVAFPPVHYSGVGKSMEVRYFTLNILLGKIRSDWIQLGSDDAWEIYQTVLGQLSSNLDNPWFASRILVLLTAAAAVAGEGAAIELVRQALDPKPIVEGPLVYELLTTVAEEIFMNTRTHSAEVVASMMEISPEIFQFLDSKVGLSNSEQEAKIFICLERWINAGFTLSELFSTYPSLLKALFGALGSKDDKCFEAAVSTLSEYIAAVDLLPEREAAVRVTTSAILAQRQLYAAAASPEELGFQYMYHKKRSRGLAILVTVLACSEASLLAQGGSEASSLLDWLVDASSGGGGLGLEGATIAAVAWPRLAEVPVSKRSEVLGSARFATAAKAVLQAQRYPEVCEDWDNLGLEDEYLRYREGPAAGAATAFFEQLGTSFLSHILLELQQAVTWQFAEVCLFTAATLSREIKGLAGLSALQGKLTSTEGEQVAARSFLSAIFVWVSASPPASEQELNMQVNWRLVQTTLLVVENFAEWTAIDLKSLEAGMTYTMNALKIRKVRDSAAMALGRVCRAAAPHIVAAPALRQVFAAYELSMSSSDRLEANARLAFVEGLAVVASALPPTDATAALRTITFTALSTVKALAEMRAAANINGQVLVEELGVLAVVVSHGSPEGGNPAVHPALPILSEIWPALDVVAGHWSADANVATALCELWGVISSRLGMVLSAVLPSIIKLATAMYTQHLVPACLDCLSNIVPLESTSINLSNEVDKFLGATLLEISKTIAGLNRIVEDARSRRALDRHHQIGREVEPEDVHQQNAEAALCSISILARSFLHNKPSILLESASFMEIIQSAIGSIGRTEVESAQAGARLLSETILCLSFSEDDFKGKVIWQLPAELVPYVDKAVELYGRHVVEVVLHTLARLQLLDALRDALADVLYGLCLRYPGETQAYMRVILHANDFPARKGVLTESDKENFISAATQHPVQPRRRFQELINNFSQVCRGSVPAEVLTGYP